MDAGSKQMSELFHTGPQTPTSEYSSSTRVASAMIGRYLKGRNVRAAIARAVLSFLAFIAFRVAAAASELPDPSPLKELPLAPKDTAVRIHYVGSDIVYSTWLTLIRRGHLFSVDYVLSYVIVNIPKPTSLSPVVPWDSIWTQFAYDDIYNLHGDKSDPSCFGGVMAVDAESVEVEVRRGDDYRKFSFYDPMHEKCTEGHQMASTLSFLQRAFANQLPLPREVREH
jgi:hypothetical protein